MSTSKKLYAGKVTIQAQLLFLIFHFLVSTQALCHFFSAILIHCNNLSEKEGIIPSFIFLGWWSYLGCWKAGGRAWRS